MAHMLNYNLAVPDVDDAGVLSALMAEGDELDVLVSAVDEPVHHRHRHRAGTGRPPDSAPRVGGRERTQRLTHSGRVRRRARAVGKPKGSGYADKAAAAGAAKPRSVLLDEWRAGRAELAAALRDTPWNHAFPWYMSKVTPALMAPLRSDGNLGTRAGRLRCCGRVTPP